MTEEELKTLIAGELVRYRERLAQGYMIPAWVLPEASCDVLETIGTALGPVATAFEFGSGASTVVLRRCFAAVTTVEDTAEWLDKTEHLPGIMLKRPADKTRAVPLTRCHLGIIPYHSFDLDRRIELLQRLEAADFILVDGPANPATREHVLCSVLQHAKPGALIFLDDLEVRATRRFAQRLARDNASMFTYHDLAIDHGVAIYHKKAMGHVVYHPTLREIVGAWLRR